MQVTLSRYVQCRALALWTGQELKGELQNLAWSCLRPPGQANSVIYQFPLPHFDFSINNFKASRRLLSGTFSRMAGLYASLGLACCYLWLILYR